MGNASKFAFLMMGFVEQGNSYDNYIAQDDGC